MGVEQQNESNEMSTWKEDRKYVLHVVEQNTLAMQKLAESIDSRFEVLDKRITRNDGRITRIQSKSGAFGTIGGILGVVLVFGFEWVRSLITKT